MLNLTFTINVLWRIKIVANVKVKKRKSVSKNKFKKQTFSSVFCADKRRKPAKNDILTKTK